MKGQTLIIEFLLFFLISFTLFTAISSFFYNQNEFFKQIIGEKVTDSLNNLILINILRGTGCNLCDKVIIKENLPSKIGGNYYKIELKQVGLKTTIFSSKFYSNLKPLFNINETFTILDSETKSENKIVEIKINNKEKELRIGK